VSAPGQAQPGGRAALRQAFDAFANGVGALVTAPSGVVIGPPGPPPPPPPPAAAPQRVWRPLGPFAIPHGQAKGGADDPRMPVAGRIAALAVDPANATHLIGGAGGGGIWESIDAGQSWLPVSDTMPSLAIGAIAFDPSVAGRVYAGTGEGDSLSYLGAGLLRSDDSGHTWAPVPCAAPPTGGYFTLKVDPEHAGVLLAGTTTGLWRSADGGRNWGAAIRPVMTWSISFHPAVPGTPGLSQEVLAASSDGLWRSTDGGRTFPPAGAVAVPGAPAFWSRLAVSHAPSAPNVVWVCGVGGTAPNGTPNDNGHVARRPGAHPAAFAAVAVPAAVPVGTMSQATYDFAMAVAPDNADTVYLGTLDVWRIDRNAITGACAFTPVSHVAGSLARGALIHSDQHAFAFPPATPGTVYVGNDGGVFRTTDRGTTWEALNRGLSILEVEYLAQHSQVDSWLLAGTQDNGTERYEGSGTWFHVADGDGGDCAVDEDAPASCYHEYFAGAQPGSEIHNERSRAGGGWESWRYATAGPTGHPTLFYPPIEAWGGMLVQAGQDVFVSDAEGDAGSFTQVAIPPIPLSNDFVSAMDIASPDRIVVGTTQGRLFELTRNAAPPPAWNVRALGAAPLVGPQYCTDVLVDRNDPRRIWATFGGVLAGFLAPTGPANTAVMRSDDGGTSFNPAIGGLPANLRTWAIAADPANPPTVFLAADRGVYRSVDRGATWTPLGAGLPNCQVKDLAFHPVARVLRAGTKSRGVWELDVDLPPAAGPEVYVRYHAVDAGRALPAGTLAPVESPDPFAPQRSARWWESPDVKLDAAPHLRPLLAGVEFDAFSDDHGLAAAGLFAEAPVPGRPARIYVQVHNRSAVHATNVDVRVFFAAGYPIGAPPLPPGFWAGWPANAPGAGSAWKPVAAAVRIADIEPGRGRLAAFDWAVPADLPGGAALLAAAAPAASPLAPAPMNLSELLAATGACGLSAIAGVRPGQGVAGPRPGAVEAFVHASTGADTYRLEVDAGSPGIVVGAVLSNGLAGQASAVSARPLNEPDFPAFGALLASRAVLGAQLDRTRLFVPPARGPWLGDLALAAGDAEPVVLLLVRPQPPRGRWTLVQRDAAGVVRGGLTVES